MKTAASTWMQQWRGPQSEWKGLGQARPAAVYLMELRDHVAKAKAPWRKFLRQMRGDVNAQPMEGSGLRFGAKL